MGLWIAPIDGQSTTTALMVFYHSETVDDMPSSHEAPLASYSVPVWASSQDEPWSSVPSAAQTTSDTGITSSNQQRPQVYFDRVEWPSHPYDASNRAVPSQQEFESGSYNNTQWGPPAQTSLPFSSAEDRDFPSQDIMLDPSLNRPESRGSGQS